MRIKPHDISPVDDTGATVADGTYGLEVVDGVATGLGAVSAGPDAPLITVVAGNPGLVIDNDGQIVYAEGPL